MINDVELISFSRR